VNLDNAFWFAYIVIEAALVGLLAYRRAWRLLPLFFAYCIWDILSNLVSFATAHFLHLNYSNPIYLTTYLAQTVIDSVLMFGVLVEVAWSVLRPIRSSLPRSALFVVAAVILILGAIIWPFVVFSNLAHYSMELRVVLHLQRTVSVLRILLFLLLAGCSQLLSISWRDRELQIATGLGFYSLVTLAVSMLQPHLVTSQQYILLNQIGVASFLCSVVYWIFSFSQKEAARQEFTPQMQRVLLAMAGTARTTRVALEDSRASKTRNPNDR
jgi:hypothetical protein